LEAAGIDLTVPTVTRYMKGQRAPDARFLLGLANVRGVDLATLTEQVLGGSAARRPATRSLVPVDVGAARRYLVNLLSRLSDAQVERLIARILDGSLAKWLDPEPDTAPPSAEPQ
jgi:transcriptional regulator with XRE-family HTH domain